ncbi:MAG TPA: hypothetical protein VLV86_11550 [Vicinamibacterales bacterium]|nr:hypothetical protein [Vicinamibacterales bacterium]
MWRLAAAVCLGIVAGACYTLSPLTAWCTALGVIVLTVAGRGLPSSERYWLRVLLVVALAARLAAIGAIFVVNSPMHDDESVAMLSGDEAYGLSRALRTRDVRTGAPVTQYDYFVAYDEYGRNSYITMLTAIQMLFGPTPYSMRLLNTLFFMTAVILLFRLTRSAFGALPAFGGLLVLLFLPTLFAWSISLLKEPLYLLVTAVILSGAVGVIRHASWRAAAPQLVAAIVVLAVARDLRPAAATLIVAGLAAGVAGFAFFSSRFRYQFAVGVMVALTIVIVTARTSAQPLLEEALDAAAKTHTGHVFTVGHAYKLLDDGFYFTPVTPLRSTLSLTTPEAARYVLRSVVSFATTPWPWQFASTRELLYLPEQVLWYVIVLLFPIGLVAGWHRDRLVTALIAGYMLPTAAAIALTNGNVGTLLRLRGIVIPYVVWLSAVGFFAVMQRMAAHRATAATV